MNTRFKKSTGVAIAMALAGTCLKFSPAAAADLESVCNFQIKAQPLESALIEFSRQADLQVIGATETLADAKTNGVSGKLTSREALNTLLENTSVAFRPIGSHSVQIVRIRDGVISQKVAHVGSITLAQGDQAVPDSGQYASRKSASSLEDKDSSTVKLEEIIVTARRREENLQTVPIAITVLSQQTLQDNNVQTLGDLQYLVPSMQASGENSRNELNISIRGQGLNATAQPGVVVYINEVPIPTDQNGFISGGPGMFFDLENIQVLKGPQGTLFGRDSVGGNVLLQTARPTNQFGGDVQLTYGNFNDREINAVINIPISDSLLTRLAVTGQVRDGFTRLLADPLHPNGVDADNRDNFGARGTVTFRPNEVFQNDMILTMTQYESHGSPDILTALNVSPTGCGGAPCAAPSIYSEYPALLAQQQALGIRTVLPSFDTLADSGSNLSLNNISRLALGDALTFRNIVGYDEMTRVFTANESGPVFPLILGPSVPYPDKFRQLTEEMQLLGKSLDGRLDWIIGGFWLAEPLQSCCYVNTNTFFGGTSSAYSQNGSKSQALFAQGTYDWSALLSGLKVTAGARYTWDASLEHTSAVPAGPFTVDDGKSSALTWTAGLDYQAALNTLLYLKASTGYHPGGSNGLDSDGNRLPDYTAEYVDNYELGVKSEWNVANIPIRTNADIFYEKYRDIQTSQLYANPVDHVVAAGLVGNAGAAKVYGAEFEAVAELTKDLQVAATFNSLRFEYTEFGSGVQPSTVASLEEARNAGQIPYKYGLSARYHLPLAPQLGDVSVRTNWNYQGSSGDYTYPTGVIHAFGLLNMTADWNGIGGSALDASLFASNVLNKEYANTIIGAYTLLGFVTERFGEPRMYGIRLRYRFGGEYRH